MLKEKEPWPGKCQEDEALAEWMPILQEKELDKKMKKTSTLEDLMPNLPKKWDGKCWASTWNTLVIINIHKLHLSSEKWLVPILLNN